MTEWKDGGRDVLRTEKDGQRRRWRTPPTQFFHVAEVLSLISPGQTAVATNVDQKIIILVISDCS